MAQAPPQYSYVPPVPELPYYNGLFSAADKQSTGYLSGPLAVEFLSTSKLPVDLLKTIWTMADQPASNTLDAHKFYVAVRLIQLFQNGKKPVDLALNVGEGEGPMRAPFFEGVNVQQIMAHGAAAQQQQPPQQQQMQNPQPSPPMQPQIAVQTAPTIMSPQGSPQRSPQQQMQQQQQQQPANQPPLQPAMNGAPPPSTTTLTVQDPYTMTHQELSRYEALFPQYAQPDDANNPASPRFVHGGAAVELFSKSGMGREALKAIWTMVDDPIDNKLDAIEFGVAMHLIVCITKKGLPMPPALPPSLGNLVAETRAARGGQPPAPPQQQQQGMGGMSVSGGAPPPSPGRIPSPDKRVQQQPQMNGGMSQMGMQGGMPQMGMGMQQQPQQQMQQPQMGGMQPQMGGMQGMGNVGGQTENIDDAFAGMSNDPVPSVDEYSAIGGIGGGDDADEGKSTMGGGMSTIGGGMGGGAQGSGGMDGGASVVGGMSTIGGFGGQGAMSTMGGLQPTVEIATLEPSPLPVAQQMQAHTAIPPPPMPEPQQQQMQQQHALQQQQMQQQQMQQQQALQQKQQQQHALPPKSPRSSAHRSPRTTEPAKSLPSHSDSSVELVQLREAHQKLQAEVISLRAKAASMSDDEQETQKEIAQVAVEIGQLSLELSDLKENLMEAKVKLSENLGTLKVQIEKKGSLETQVAEARETHETLTSAVSAVEEANELAMAQQARAVAAAAVAREEASVAPVAAPTMPVVEQADLFSWDAVANPPAPAPVAAAQESESLMSAWGTDSPSVQPSVHDSNPSHLSLPDAGAQQPAPALWGASDAASVTGTVHSNMGGGGAPPAEFATKDNTNVHSAAGGGIPAINPNPYGGGMGMGGLDFMGGGAMGGVPAPHQPAMPPMGGGLHDPSGFGDRSVAGSVAANSVAPTPTPVATTTDRSFSNDAPVAQTPTNQSMPHQASASGPPSPTKGELEALKGKTARAENGYRSCADLVRTISTEVVSLEAAAKKAETEMQALEEKKKKGSFGGKKKKAKKQYEFAMEVAKKERDKVQEAKDKLAGAEREAAKAKNEMDQMRQEYEQMELEAATAASYMSVQRSHSTSTEQSSMAGRHPSENQYSDPYGQTMNHAHPPAPMASSSDPYGMGTMGGALGGGGDYANPFAI